MKVSSTVKIPPAALSLFATFLLCALTIGRSEEPAAIAGKEFNVADFGAVADGKTDAGPAFRDAVTAAIAAGPGAVVKVGAGIWRLMPAAGKNACVPIPNTQGLTVCGEPGKTELSIGAPRCTVFALSECEGTEVRGFSIDFSPLPFTQGKIVSIDPKAGTFDITIDPGYPSLDEPMFAQTRLKYERWGMFMDSQTRWLKPGAPNFILIDTITRKENGLWCLQTASGDGGKLGFMAPGDLYVQLARGGGTVFTVEKCRNCTIADSTVYSSPGCSVVSVANDALVVRGLHVRFKPGTDRLISTDADGIHNQQNIKGPLVEGCSFEGMADDAINIYSTAAVVREVLSSTMFAISRNGAIEKGDRLQVIDPKTGQVRGEAEVAQIEPSRAVGNLRNVTLSEPVAGVVAGKDSRSGDMIFNMTRCGAGYVIRSNQFNRFRGRGILTRAGNGLIEGNTFTNPSSNDIALADEPDSAEGPVPWNIKIRNNIFTGGGDDAVIRIITFRSGFKLADGRSLRDITIEDNLFTDPPGTAIFIGAAKNIVIRNNRIIRKLGAPFRKNQPALDLANCGGIVIENLIVSDPGRTYSAFVHIGKTVDPDDSGIKITNMKNDRDVCLPVEDDRKSRTP